MSNRLLCNEAINTSAGTVLAQPAGNPTLFNLCDMKPLTNNSLHGVAGEIGLPVEKNDRSTTPTRPNKSWFEGMLRIPRPPLPSSNLSSNNTSLTSTEKSEGSQVIDDNGVEYESNKLEHYQVKLAKQQDELDQLRHDASYFERLNIELSHQTNESFNDIEAQDRIKELTSEIASEKSEKFRLLRQIKELNVRVDELETTIRQERSVLDSNDDIDQRLVSLTRELAETKLEQQRAQRTVARLQKEQNAIGSLYDKKLGELNKEVLRERENLSDEREKISRERENLQEQIGKLKQQESNTAEWKRQLYQKDDTITQLKTQISELGKSLKIAEDRHEASSAEAQLQEQYRSEEARDLRLLTDAQQEQISRLKLERVEIEKKATNNEEKLKDLECYVNRLPNNEITQTNEAVNRSIAEIEEMRSRVEQDDEKIKCLETELSQSRRLIEDLQRTINENKGNHETEMQGLIFKVNGLSEERDSLNGQVRDLNASLTLLNDERNVLRDRESKSFDSRPEDTSGSVQQFQEAFEELHKRYKRQERDLLEAKLKLAAAEEQNVQLKEDGANKQSKYREEKLSDTSYERAQRLRAQRIFDTSSEPTKDSSRVASLLAEIEALSTEIAAIKSTHQNEVAIPKQSIDSCKEESDEHFANSGKLMMGIDAKLEHHTKISELHAKINDRDTTISTLVKSTVALEDQLQASNTEIDVLRSMINEKTKEHLSEKKRCDKDDESNVSALKSEIKKLKKELKSARDESFLSKSLCINETIHPGVASPPENQLRERDTAISKLVKQSIVHERTIASLRQECEAATHKIHGLENGMYGLVSLKEVNELKKEAEVFASQVIEQDEEIQELKGIIAEQERQITTLEVELADAKQETSIEVHNSPVIQNLEAEVDELKEANAEQLEELRQLRKKVREVETSVEALNKAKNETIEARNEASEYQQRVDELSLEKARLFRDLEAARAQLQEIETQLTENLKEINERSSEIIQKLTEELDASRKECLDLKISAQQVDEVEMECMRTEIRTLQSSLSKQSHEADFANSSIKEMEKVLAQRSAEDAAAHEDEKDELVAEIESLNQQLEEVREQLHSFELERELLDNFKTKVVKADEEREESEQTIIATYESRISELALDKDASIDNLRKQLFAEKHSNAETVESLTEQIETYENEINGLRVMMSDQITEKETRIYALERTLQAQEQLVNSMRTEMDQLQGSMETSAARRRQEVDDLQGEILTLSATNTKLDREIQLLKLELDSKDMTHNATITKLKEVISKYENQNQSEHRTAADLQIEIRMKEVRDRLEKLKWRNTSLKAENENLRERLEMAELQARENIRQVAQTEELRGLVSSQTIQLEVLQVELEQERQKADVRSPIVEIQQNLPPRSLPLASSKKKLVEEDQSASQSVSSKEKVKNQEKKVAATSQNESSKEKVKNQEKKVAAGSSMRMSFLRKRTNSSDAKS